MVNNHSYPADKCTFELLSAYLDGEVTAQERQEIQSLLRSDLELQKMYQRLLNLRKKIGDLPSPQAEYSSSDLSQAVFARIDQEERQKQKRWFWGGSAIAALVLVAISSIFSESRIPSWQMAKEENLVIALNEPLIELPEQSGSEQESLVIPLSEPLF
jgi:anti-sigma factor RsiW